MNLSSFYTRFSLILFAAFFTANTAHAQWYDPEKVSKKATAFYQAAYDEFSAGKYAESLAHLDDALKADSKFLDVYTARADMYARMKNYDASVKDYATVFEKDSVFARDFKLQYSVSLAGAVFAVKKSRE